MIGLALLTSHLLADFPLQTDRMAAKKLESIPVRAGHVQVHLMVTAALLYPLVGVYQAVVAAWVVSVLHFVIDSRRWAAPKDGFESWPVVIDQVLHVASLYLVGMGLYLA